MVWVADKLRQIAIDPGEFVALLTQLGPNGKPNPNLQTSADRVVPIRG